MQGLPRSPPRSRPEHVAVCSTGVIGVPLEADKIVRRSHVCGRSSATTRRRAQRAIQTTDAFEKRACLQVELEPDPSRRSAGQGGA